MLSPQAKAVTLREWRELGYFYDRDDTSRTWVLRGSVSGLLGFARSVRLYAAEPRNAAQSEHIHLGPYSYLEVGTWHEPEITEHWIAGPVGALARLSAELESRLGFAAPGAVFYLRSFFAPAAPYELAVHVEEPDFDPASADSECR